MILFTLTCFMLISAIFPAHVEAIIILPAIILIPIAKMVAIIVGLLSIPVAGLGLLIKTFTKNRKLATVVSLISLALIIIAATLVLKYKFPDNPWI